MIRSLKPYKGGNEALRAVHDLDITDKHDSLVSVGQIVGMRYLDLQGRGVSITEVEFTPVIVGMEVLAFSGSADAKVSDNTEVAIRVTLGKGQPFQGEAVVPTLHQLTNWSRGSFGALNRLSDTHVLTR
jgi:hypothetical protein